VGAACVLGLEAATCATGVGTCTSADINTCFGDHIVWSCNWGQPVTFNCAAANSACDDSSDEALCVGEAGAGCDGDLLLCAEGLVCSGATPESLGTCVDEEEACQGVDFEGECVGTMLRFCFNEELLSFDCAEAFPEPGVCRYIAADWGYDCAAAVGDACLFSDGAGGLDFAFCGGAEPGCVLSDVDSACVEGLGTCTAGDPNACVDNYLILGCNLVQPWALDCEAYGGTCGGGASPACVGLPVGAECYGSVLQCGRDLVCDERTGTCQGTTSPCGGVTFEGMCEGTVLSYCLDDEEVVEVNCATVFPSPAMNVCTYITPGYGYDCAVKADSPCFYRVGDDPYVAFCEGADAACVIDADSEICVNGIGTCDETDEDTCIGNYLVIYCNLVQPFVIDCAAFGLECDDTGAVADCL
jgi:hypothetical protein